MFDKKSEGIIDRFRFREMVVIQDKDKITRDGGNFIDQNGQRRFG